MHTIIQEGKSCFVGLLVLLLLIAYVVTSCIAHSRKPEHAVAYVLLREPDDAVSPVYDWRHSKDNCAWCGREVSIRRCTIVLHPVGPLFKDVSETVVILCHSCHFVLGHRRNWDIVNPDVLYICTHFTNSLHSAVCQTNTLHTTHYTVENKE